MIRWLLWLDKKQEGMINLREATVKAFLSVVETALKEEDVNGIVLTIKKGEAPREEKAELIVDIKGEKVKISFLATILP